MEIKQPHLCIFSLAIFLERRATDRRNRTSRATHEGKGKQLMSFILLTVLWFLSSQYTRVKQKVKEASQYYIASICDGGLMKKYYATLNLYV